MNRSFGKFWLHGHCWQYSLPRIPASPGTRPCPCALTIGVLACVIQVSDARNWFLVWMIFVLYFGITWVNTLIEALVFQVLPPLVAFQSGTLGLTTTFTVTVALCFSMDRMRVPRRALGGRSPKRFALEICCRGLPLLRSLPGCRHNRPPVHQGLLR